MVESLRFASGESFDLEGILEGDGDRGVVLCHPHPAFGGTMSTPSLMVGLAEELARRGWRALRFNFRGVGASGGRGQGGLVEQRDVRAACAWLRSRGVRELVLVGYSFGALMAAKAIGEGERVAAWVGIGFPTGIIASHPDRVADVESALAQAPALLVSGSEDRLSDVKALRHWQESAARARVVTLAGAGHFFVGEGEVEVRRLTHEFLEENVPRVA